MKFYDRKEELKELRRVQKQAFEELLTFIGSVQIQQSNKTNLHETLLDPECAILVF